jgi:hypothetical protein
MGLILGLAYLIIALLGVTSGILVSGTRSTQFSCENGGKLYCCEDYISNRPRCLGNSGPWVLVFALFPLLIKIQRRG